MKPQPLIQPAPANPPEHDTRHQWLLKDIARRIARLVIHAHRKGQKKP